MSLKYARWQLSVWRTVPRWPRPSCPGTSRKTSDSPFWKAPYPLAQNEQRQHELKHVTSRFSRSQFTRCTIYLTVRIIFIPKQHCLPVKVYCPSWGADSCFPKDLVPPAETRIAHLRHNSSIIWQLLRSHVSTGEYSFCSWLFSYVEYSRKTTTTVARNQVDGWNVMLAYLQIFQSCCLL